jgi:hypothetical protein
LFNELLILQQRPTDPSTPTVLAKGAPFLTRRGQSPVTPHEKVSWIERSEIDLVAHHSLKSRQPAAAFSGETSSAGKTAMMIYFQNTPPHRWDTFRARSQRFAEWLELIFGEDSQDGEPALLPVRVRIDEPQSKETVEPEHRID